MPPDSDVIGQLCGDVIGQLCGDVIGQLCGDLTGQKDSTSEWLFVVSFDPSVCRVCSVYLVHKSFIMFSSVRSKLVNSFLDSVV